ncbi:MAG: hypothetical protein HN849_29990 [Victivallales bacterium]|jgi:hypothetical protein|nr:hypothetical protein [Verrucomicrobiota bacterium]MBT7303800.1 hypothetical protein [Victivallales bacterium]
MKKPTTIYFTVMLGLHLLFGWGLIFMNEQMRETYSRCLAGQPLQTMTVWTMRLHLWPFVFAGAAVVGLAMSFGGESRTRALGHVAFALQCASALFMFASGLGYTLPLCPWID